LVITKLIGKLEAAIILTCQQGKQAKSFFKRELKQSPDQS
jgi:hypothetical protein